MDAFGGNDAPYPYATNVCAVDATSGDINGLFASWAGNEIAQQQAWETAYANAADKARQSAFEQAAIQVGIAGLQFAATQYAADRQFDIADRQMRIAEEEHDRYRKHFWCVENLMADEACSEMEYIPDFPTRVNRAVIDGRRIFGIQRKQRERMRKRYCASDFVRDDCDLLAIEAKSIADLQERATRVEEAREDAFSDRRFNRQLAVSKFGRNLQNGYVALSTQATQFALGAIQTELAGVQNFLGTVSGALLGANQSRFSPAVSFAPQSQGAFTSAPTANTSTTPNYQTYNPYLGTSDYYGDV